MEIWGSVADGLDSCLTPGVLATTTVHISNEGVLGLCWRVGDKNHLAEGVLACLREMIAVD